MIPLLAERGGILKRTSRSWEKTSPLSLPSPPAGSRGKVLLFKGEHAARTARGRGNRKGDVFR
jgi:hypothetical protein